MLTDCTLRQVTFPSDDIFVRNCVTIYVPGCW